MIVSGVLALFLAFGGQDGSPPTSGVPDAVEQEATPLSDVVVTRTPGFEAADAFVRSVAAPIGDRDMALWRDPLCVGMGNLRADAAQIIVDRISDWAGSLGLRIGEPGCRPNVFIVATDDGDAAARDLVASRPREFATGVGGSDRGRAALARFQQSDRLVRWWHVSLAVDERTGNPIRRMPGQPPVDWTGRRLTRTWDFGVNSMMTSPSRLIRAGRDDLQQVIVVLDVEAFEDASIIQVSDYIAMVALAQIDPDARPAYPSILSLFDAPGGRQETLTRWDRAFLHGLYAAEQNRADPRANQSTISQAMAERLATEVEGGE